MLTHALVKNFKLSVIVNLFITSDASLPKPQQLKKTMEAAWLEEKISLMLPWKPQGMFPAVGHHSTLSFHLSEKFKKQLYHIKIVFKIRQNEQKCVPEQLKTYHIVWNSWNAWWVLLKIFMNLRHFTKIILQRKENQFHILTINVRIMKVDRNIGYEYLFNTFIWVFKKFPCSVNTNLCSSFC